MNIVKSQTYSIYIGDNALQEIELSAYSKIAILVDENSRHHCLELFLEKTTISYDLLIEIPAGEQHKTIITCQQIWDELTDENFDRKSILINLGGGVIGDMGGFAASCYKRGLDFIQVPTTLLAMIDASVGGKTAIDYANLKNQIGLFNDPKGVYIFPAFLNTLAKEHISSAYAEVVKHALIKDAKMWKFLCSTKMEVINWTEIIAHSVSIKNEIVMSDPYELGLRKILNFGHSIGHAIESYYLSIGKEILHGEAVAIGMLLESQLSHCSLDEKAEIRHFLQSTFRLVELPNFNAIFPFLQHDKKNENNELKFSLLSEIGKCDYNCSIDIQHIKALFD